MAYAKNPGKRLEAYMERHRELTAKLSGIGFIWPGNIQRRYITCGKPYCACRKDPKARHGPYAYWTSKEDKKTVSKLLSSEEADLLEEWIENRRKLEKIVSQMKDLSRKAFKTALRAKERRARGIT